jgi:trehalose 6-phosphate phosphatase
VLERRLLEPWLEHPETAAVLSDFDGTLAAIVQDPQSARPFDGMVDALRALAARYGRVAVVSGRPVQYLVDHVGDLPGVTLVGLYGLERTIQGRAAGLPESERWRPVIADLAARAQAAAPPGVYVEDKGLAVTLHYRLAPDQQTWAEHFSEKEAGAAGVEAMPGRKSIELRPPVTADKGTVIAELAAGMTAVCFVGDDTGDLPAFAALSDLRRSGVATLAVAVASPESPPELLDAADIRVDGPAGTLGFFRALTS